jgi:hypothetical protein
VGTASSCSGQLRLAFALVPMRKRYKVVNLQANFETSFLT